MLIEFKVRNWMSFRDDATLSMTASREKQHAARLAVAGPKSSPLKVLSAAAIYGANASGKTNLVSALDAARRFIVFGTGVEEVAPCVPFELDDASRSNPTGFSFTVLAGDGQVYGFEFAISGGLVTEERLVRIGATAERTLYHRTAGDADPHLHGAMGGGRLKVAFDCTRPNQLFLTNTVLQNIDEFAPVYRWFQKSLAIVRPDSRPDAFEPYWNEGSAEASGMYGLLSMLDTGVVRLEGEEIPLETFAGAAGTARLGQSVRDGETVRLRLGGGGMATVCRSGGRLVAKRLYSIHRDSHGGEHRFELSRESDGTLRLLDLLPVFQRLSSTDGPLVVVIDELDRSMHSLLTRSLVEKFLGACGPAGRSQLVFTTHDVMLMDQSLLRRDEMWVTERASDGASRLWSFSEYADVRYDRDIRKSYLQGRMGGIPRILAMPPRPDCGGEG